MIELNWDPEMIKLVNELAKIILLTLAGLGTGLLLIGIATYRNKFRFAGVTMILTGCAWCLGSFIVVNIQKSGTLNLLNLSMSLSMIPLVIGILLWSKSRKFHWNRLGIMVFSIGMAQFIGEVIAKLLLMI